jgi:putative transposase
MYESGLLGDGFLPGRGLPPPPADPAKLRLDFMPMIERTVQQYGLKIDGIQYYDPVLDNRVRSKNPVTKKPQKFILRQDPRDISIVYFLDPDTKRYYPIPYRNLSHPSMSVWELREVKLQLKKEGRDEVDECLIFETYELMNKLVEQAQSTSVKARKSAQKKRQRTRTKQNESAQEGVSLISLPTEPTQSDWGDEELDPFDMEGSA